MRSLERANRCVPTHIKKGEPTGYGSARKLSGRRSRPANCFASKSPARGGVAADAQWNRATKAADITLWLDGWGVPWYSRLFAVVTRRWLADLFWFSEREPFGIKDKRVRALVTAAIQSGDSSQAGQLSNPGSVMLELRWLVKTVRRELGTIRQPSLILHPREDDRASLRNALHLRNKLPGRVEVLVLNDSYHVITLDRQRQVVIDRTNQFAASISHQQVWPDDVLPLGTFEAKSCPL